MRRITTLVVGLLAMMPLGAYAACASTSCIYLPLAESTTRASPLASALASPSAAPSSPSVSLPPSPSASARPGALVWTTLSGAPAPTQRSEAQGAVVGGKLYVFSGYAYPTNGFNPYRIVSIYDSVSGGWTTIVPTDTSIPYGFTHAGVAEDAENVYFAGGYIENASRNGQIFGTKNVWRYTVASATWTQLADLPVERAAGALALVGRTLHFFGGTNTARTTDTGEHWALDLDAPGSTWQPRAPLPNPRNHLGAVALDGLIYAIGGQHGHDAQLTTQRDVDRYDPATNTWTAVAPLPPLNGAYGRGHITNASFVLNGSIVVAGGEYAHTKPVADVTAYDPATNSWSSLTPLPAPRLSGVARPIGDAIYFATGGTSSAFTDTVFMGTFGERAAAAAARSRTLDWVRFEMRAFAPVYK